MKTLILTLAMAALVFADTGLDFPSNGQSPVNGFVAMQYPNPQNNGLPFWGPSGAGATYIWKYYPRQQAGYYVTMWWSNNGSFLWDGGSSNTYYGGHPYPRGGGGSTTTHDWEVATDRGGDYITTLSGSSKTVVKSAWYTQALVVDGSARTVRFYITLPSTANGDIIQVNLPSSYGNLNPPSPAFTFGDSPWYQQFYGNERLSGVLRHIKIFNKKLSQADILAEAAAENLATSEGAANIWYMNINPTPSDISDKSGKGHNFAWANSYKAALWSSGPVVTVTGLSVDPASASVEELLTRQFTATATFSDHSTQTVTGSATWSSNNTSIATVNPSGLATGKSAGGAKIIAFYSGFRDTADLTVTPSTAVLESLTITGSTGHVVEGNTAALSATGHYSNGQTQDKTAQASWSSSSDGLATVSAGVVTGRSLGTVTITASLEGKEDTVILQVIEQPAFVKKINFQPSGAALPSGYEADDGSAYTSGRGYGWQTAVVEARDRDVNADQRYDTFVKTYSATDWKIDLPSAGDYKITAVMGDPSYSTANTLSSGGRTIISAAASTGHTAATDTLTVSGTQLTLSVTGAICYIDIESAGGSTVHGPAAGVSPGFRLERNMPNPFHASTALRYSIGASAMIKIRIVDQAGRVVRVLAGGKRAAGRHEAVWDGRGPRGRTLANGVYIAEVWIDRAVYTRKLVLAR